MSSKAAPTSPPRTSSNWTDSDRALMVRHYLDICPPNTEFYKHVATLLPQFSDRQIRQQWSRRVSKEMLSLFGGSGEGEAGRGPEGDGAAQKKAAGGKRTAIAADRPPSKKEKKDTQGEEGRAPVKLEQGV